MSKQFIATGPWQSKLIPHQKEILYAWFKERATLKMIQDRLAEKGTTITLSSLSRFINRRKQKIDPHDLVLETIDKHSQNQTEIAENEHVKNFEENIPADHQARIRILKMLISSAPENIE
jgi:uncharacterized protein YbcC (UPF0753/DUF2309 family)